MEVREPSSTSVLSQTASLVVVSNYQEGEFLLLFLRQSNESRMVDVNSRNGREGVCRRREPKLPRLRPNFQRVASLACLPIWEPPHVLIKKPLIYIPYLIHDFHCRYLRATEVFVPASKGYHLHSPTAAPLGCRSSRSKNIPSQLHISESIPGPSRMRKTTT